VDGFCGSVAVIREPKGVGIIYPRRPR
jgi:hypothetical protein